MRTAPLLLLSLPLLAGCGKPADLGITGPGLTGIVSPPSNDPASLNPLNLPTDAGFAGGQQGFPGPP